MNNTGTFKKLSPEGLLRQLTNSSDTTCLQVSENSVIWSIYLERGKIIYATHSVEPFDRLERHIRRLSQQMPLVTNEARIQLRMKFEPDWQIQLHESDHDNATQPPEYEAIHWLLTEKYLVPQQAALLIQELVKEVIESFLLIRSGTYELISPLYSLPRICKLDAENIMERCQQRLQNWLSFAPQISSPFQRPYLLIHSKFYDQQLPELQQNLTTWMKGFSLRHLAVIMNVDEAELANTLYPHILQGSIILHQPDPPFDQLPPICENIPFTSENSIIKTNGKSQERGLVPKQHLEVDTLVTANSVLKVDNPQFTLSNSIESEVETVNTATITAKKPYKIISVDDSPTVL
ncbi:MAG: DUF4388 domain-containing protein, partial [Sphaerospermopsis sp. SIO1G2]|nr:DUF4388 domain-containing protein [Sphaerospermopsis sp. SIO1G2]